MTSSLLAIDLAYWQVTTIKVVIVLSFIPLSALILGYVFLLKMMSHMQSRLGPMEAGPHGVLQLVADGVKFIQKEDIFPDKADRFVFAIAPLVVVLSTFLLFVVVPAGPDIYVEPRTVDVHIRRLRAALEASGNHERVETVRGTGYRFRGA